MQVDERSRNRMGEERDDTCWHEYCQSCKTLIDGLPSSAVLCGWLRGLWIGWQKCISCTLHCSEDCSKLMCNVTCNNKEKGNSCRDMALQLRCTVRSGGGVFYSLHDGAGFGLLGRWLSCRSLIAGSSLLFRCDQPRPCFLKVLLQFLNASVFLSVFFS